MPPINIAVPDVRNALFGYRQGSQDAQERTNRNALLRAGQAAAGGDYKGAASAAFGAGDLASGSRFLSLGNEEQKREIDTLARLAYSADTPQKLQAAAVRVGELFGPEKAQEFMSTPREQFISEAQSISEMISQKIAADNAKRAQANADRAYGLQERKFKSDESYNAERLAIERGKPRGTSDQQNYQSAVSQGFTGSFFDYQKTLAEAKAGGKPLTEAQSKAAGFAERMMASDKIMGNPDIAATGLSRYQSAVSDLPVIGSGFASAERQQYDQAQRDFINAVLRRESGAVISDAEFANAEKQYFPQPGDGPKVLAQKAANRKTAIQGILRAAGPAAEGLTAATGDSGGVVDAADYFK